MENRQAASSEPITARVFNRLPQVAQQGVPFCSSCPASRGPRWHPYLPAKVGAALARLGARRPSWEPWPSPVCPAFLVPAQTPTEGLEEATFSTPRAPAFLGQLSPPPASRTLYPGRWLMAILDQFVNDSGASSPHSSRRCPHFSSPDLRGLSILHAFGPSQEPLTGTSAQRQPSEEGSL